MAPSLGHHGSLFYHLLFVLVGFFPWSVFLGPTGLALGENGTLYLASTEDNKILAISEAMTRTTPAANGGAVVTQGGHLKEPLGMVLAVFTFLVLAAKYESFTDPLIILFTVPVAILGALLGLWVRAIPSDVYS